MSTDYTFDPDVPVPEEVVKKPKIYFSQRAMNHWYKTFKDKQYAPQTMKNKIAEQKKKGKYVCYLAMLTAYNRIMLEQEI